MADDRLQPSAPVPLARSLGVTGVLLLTLSVATPASSVFVIVPGMLQVAGTGAIWAMILAGIVCVAIVGGAVVPVITGALADRFGLQVALAAPILCYACVAAYGLAALRSLADPEPDEAAA